jgi:hypothetical protein
MYELADGGDEEEVATMKWRRGGTVADPGLMTYN